MHMDHTATADTPITDTAAEPETTPPQPPLSAHELQVIMLYRTASDETRARVRHMLANLLSG